MRGKRLVKEKASCAIFQYTLYKYVIPKAVLTKLVSSSNAATKRRRKPSLNQTAGTFQSASAE